VSPGARSQFLLRIKKNCCLFSIFRHRGGRGQALRGRFIGRHLNPVPRPDAAPGRRLRQSSSSKLRRSSTAMTATLLCRHPGRTFGAVPDSSPKASKGVHGRPRAWIHKRMENARFRGRSRHRNSRASCQVMTHSGHRFFIENPPIHFRRMDVSSLCQWHRLRGRFGWATAPIY
jgi:hypothetical protein